MKCLAAPALLLAALLCAACSSPKPSGTIPDAYVSTHALGDAADQRCVVETYDQNACEHCENQFCCAERFACYDDRDCFYGHKSFMNCLAAASGDGGTDAVAEDWGSDASEDWGSDATSDAGPESSGDAASPVEACWNAADEHSTVFKTIHDCARKFCQTQCAVP